MKTIENLRICLLSPSRWRYTKRLVDGLCALNQRVFVFVDKRKSSDIRNIKYPKCSVKQSWRQNALLPWYLIKLPLDIIKVQPHIVHIQFEYLVFGRLFISIFFPLLLLLLRLIRTATDFRIVLTMHSLIPLDKVKSFERNLLLPYTKMVVRLSDKVIVHTKLAKEVLVKTYGVDENKLDIIPHGVETRFPSIHIQKIKEKLNLNGKKTVLHFGIIRTSKGLNKLLSAFKKVLCAHPNVSLLIVGWFHEYLTSLEMRKIFSSIETNDALKKHVKALIGYVPEDKLYQIISSSNVICLPYTENYVVGVSGAVADIVMWGKPVVVTECIKFLEFKRFPNVIFTPDDEESLADTLIKTLKKSVRTNLDAAHLGKCSWDAVAEKTLSCYHTILSREDHPQ